VTPIALDAETAALRAGAGAFRAPRDVVAVRGPDAEAYLQGQLSQDVEALSVGASADALLLEPDGKLSALLRVTRTDGQGFVLDVDRSTPSTLFWHGEGFHLERLPEGSRVIYAPEPMKAIEDPYRAIRHALLHPLGDRDPLPALLRPA